MAEGYDAGIRLGEAAAQDTALDAIARAVLYAIDQPGDVDVNEILIRPVAQGF